MGMSVSRKVAEHSSIIVEELNKSGMFPYEISMETNLDHQ